MYPHIGTRTDDPTIRRMTALPYPHLIFYEATETEIIIHAVRHAARDPSGMPVGKLPNADDFDYCNLCDARQIPPRAPPTKVLIQLKVQPSVSPRPCFESRFAVSG